MSATVAELTAAVAVEGLPSAEAGLASFGNSVDVAAAKQSNAAKQSMSHDEAMRKIGSSALVAGGLIDAGIGLAIGTTMNFDKALSGVAAVSNATGGQLDRLRKAAIDAGQATAFSASDAATAEGELAKAGLSTSQILGGGLSGALALAAAGQLGLADAATITAQTLNEFKLSGGQASHVADVLAAGANKSAADVESLGQGLGNVGGLANRAGISLEETAGVLSLFSDNALAGAEGGTALKSMLLAIQAPSSQASDMMKQLGIEAYDSQGKFVGLAKFAGNLKTALGGLTEQQRDQAMATIFGSFGIQAAGILYDAGAGKVRDYTKAVNDSGAAARMSAVQMDNLSGDIEQLKGSIETGLITSASGGTNVLRMLTQSATGLVNGFVQLPPAIQTGISGVVAFSGVALTGVGVAVKFTEKLNEWKSAAAGVSPALGSAVGGLGKLAAAAALAGVSMSAAGEDGVKGAGGVLGMAASGAMLGSVFPGVGTAIGAVAGGIAGMTLNLMNGGENVNEYRKRIAGLSTELDALGAKAAAHKFVDSLGMEDLIKLAAGGTTAVRGIRDELNVLGTTSPAAVAKVVDSLKAMHNEDGKPLFTGKALAELDGIVAGVNRRYKENADNAGAAAATNSALRNGADALGSSISAVGDKFKDADDKASAFKTTLDHVLGIGLDVESANLKWRDSLAAVSKGLVDNGATLDINTEAGRKNRELLAASTQNAIGFAESEYHLHGSIDEVNGIIGTQIGNLEMSANAMGLTGDQALAYTEDLFGIPANVRTGIHNNAELAGYLVSLYAGVINNTPTDHTTRFWVDNSQALAAIQGVISAANSAGFAISNSGVFGFKKAAAGMVVEPRPGGVMVNVGEGGAREVIVPTNDLGRAADLLRQGGLGGLLAGDQDNGAAGNIRPVAAALMPAASDSGPSNVTYITVPISVSGVLVGNKRELGRVVNEAVLSTNRAGG